MEVIMKRKRSVSATRARRWSEAEARRILAELGRSGLSVARFASERGLGAERLRRWRRRLKAGAGKKAEAPRFTEVTLRPATGAPIEVVLPDGCVVRCAGASRLEDAVAILSRLTER
jgi:transposase-like protein